MKKQLMGFTLSVTLVLSTMTTVSADEGTTIGETKKAFTTGKQVEEAAIAYNEDGGITPKEKAVLYERSTKEAIIEFENLCLQEINDSVRDMHLENDEIYKTISVELPSGATAQIEMYDLNENEELDKEFLKGELVTKESEISTNSAIARSGEIMPVVRTDHYYYSPSGGEYKNYGNRYFTSQYTYGFPTGTGRVTLKVENHYSIGDYGLKERYGTVYKAYAGNVSSVSATSSITDSTATSVGTDINILGSLSYNRVVGSLAKGPYYLQLDTMVRLDKLDKSNKRALIMQHTYVLRTSEI